MSQLSLITALCSIMIITQCVANMELKKNHNQINKKLDQILSSVNDIKNKG